MSATAVYTYCVVHRKTKPPAGRLPAGMPGAEKPQIVEMGRSMWLVASDVPLTLYGPEALSTTLRDISRVGELALSHEAVVDHFRRVRGSTVIPFKLFTMFSTRTLALEEMERRRSQLDAVVARIRGCEEWGVRIHRAGRTESPMRPARPLSGKEFLAARKLARGAAQAAAEDAARAADEVYRSLSRLARDVTRRDDVPPGAAAPPLLDASFLVPSTARTRFKTTARRAAARCLAAGASLTLTGPWPAYNFVAAGERRE